MKLSDFIRKNMDRILDIWEDFAQDISSARNLNAAELRDHASGMLHVIASDLDRTQTPHEQAEKSKGHGPRSAQLTQAEMHGVGRVLEGFTVNDAMSEFRALRASVLRLWSDSKPPAPEASIEELTRFNEAIDQALAESLVRYSSEKERYTRLFDTLLSSSPDLNFIVGVDGKLIYANRSMACLYDMSVSEIVGKDIFHLGAPDVSELWDKLQHAIDAKATYRVDMPHALSPGKILIYEYLFIPVINENGEVEAVAGTAHDITERKASEQEIRRTAHYDFLTGLPNRSLFRDRLQQEVKRSMRTGLPFALFFVDLDGFKEVNDRLGHDAGDRLLQQVAQRIGACVRGADTIARIGGDEFTVIIADVNKTSHVDILAQKIIEELAKPFSILQKEVHISGSIGISLFPQDAATPDDLLRNADQAMYVAKKAGRGRFSLFTIGMRDSAWARLKVIDALRHALPEHQLAVYYQPIIALSTGKIVMAEALLRWHHPQDGLVLPGEFIGLAEESGLIGEIGEWVLCEAVTRAQEWGALVGAPFHINVNKSPLEFMGKEPMKDWETDLTACGLAGSCITVEITEGILLNDSPNVREKLGAFQKAGMQLAIDDFGTGYSTISYLKKFKVDYVKIDQSFVQCMTTDMDSRLFAETIIMMAHKLGLKVIAEGVETAEQRDWLHTAGCDYAQGYLFSAPLPSHQFASLLSRDTKAHPRQT